jgi:8-oxo-dGTP pyrophosphatase MutT (NUDIX family)
MADRIPMPPWPTVGRSIRREHGVFATEEVQRRSPRTGEVRPFQLLHMPDWVNVIALTEDEQVVLVEQYRHGIDAVTVEVPGGMVDPGEDPAAAAVRELREETGYVGEAPQPLGWVHPNPALQTNRCSTWLIRNVRAIAVPEPDEGEHLGVLTVPRHELPAWIRQQRITHSLVIAALQHWWLADPAALDPPATAAGGSIPDRV